MKYLRAFFLTLLLTSLAAAQSIRVSAAISLREAITDAATAYESETHEHIEFVFGSSGQLMTQIKDGAPVDLFISAASAQVNELVAANLALPDTKQIVVTNSLVLIEPAGASSGLTGFASLRSAPIKKLAIGEPKTVPAGQYAMQALTALKVADALKDKLVFGSNVRQVLSYVEAGEVTAGIVYATDALQSGDKVKVIATAEPSLTEPIVYPAVIIKASTHQDSAKKFLAFLTSSKGRELFTKRGFSTAPTTRPAE